MSAGLSIEVHTPLSWPARAKRTPGRDRKFAPFRSGGSSITVAQAKKRILDSLSSLVTDRKPDGNRYYRASEIVLSLNDTVGRKITEDPGAVLYFKLDGRQYTLPCDKWHSAAGNVAAIAAHLEAMRGMERWGVGTLEQLFEGYAQLPQNTEEWWQVLGVDRDSTHEQIENAYRELSKKAHPDVGGTNDAQARLNKAIGYYRDHIRKVGIQK